MKLKKLFLLANLVFSISLFGQSNSNSARVEVGVENSKNFFAIDFEFEQSAGDSSAGSRISQMVFTVSRFVDQKEVTEVRALNSYEIEQFELQLEELISKIEEKRKEMTSGLENWRDTTLFVGGVATVAAAGFALTGVGGPVALILAGIGIAGTGIAAELQLDIQDILEEGQQQQSLVLAIIKKINQIQSEGRRECIEYKLPFEVDQQLGLLLQSPSKVLEANKG